MKNKKQVVLGVTGSIAAYKSADIIRLLAKKGFKSTVIMTNEAKCFITPLTLSSISGEKVYSNMLGEESSSKDISHISLGKQADVLLIAPATANIIGKIASGIADDLLTCTCLSTKAPIIIAPAMNPDMYENKIVQENCNKLKKRGFLFVGPIKGNVACGDTGLGHIADTKDIVLKIMQITK